MVVIMTSIEPAAVELTGQMTVTIGIIMAIIIIMLRTSKVPAVFELTNPKRRDVLLQRLYA